MITLNESAAASRRLRHGQRQRHAAEQRHPRRHRLVVAAVVLDRRHPGGAGADARRWVPPRRPPNLPCSKNTNDGGAVYVIGNNVIFNITARCNPGGSTGNLLLTSGASSTRCRRGSRSCPRPRPRPATLASATVARSRGTTRHAASLPAGCSANGAGDHDYTARGRSTRACPMTPSRQRRHADREPLGTNQPLSTSASRKITAIDDLPGQRRQFPRQDLLGPLDVPNFGFAAPTRATGSPRSTSARVSAREPPRASTRSRSVPGIAGIHDRPGRPGAVP